MPTYLCDTNVVWEIMRREPHPAVLAWFRGLDVVGLSAIALEELVFGLRRKGLYEKEAWLRRFCAQACVVYPVEAEDAFWAGEKRGEFSARGRTVHQADALIAAAAWRNGLVLATRNTRNFEGFGIALIDPFAG